MSEETNPSFLWGDGIFETLRSENGRLLRLEAHLERMGKSLREFDYPSNLLDQARMALTSRAWEDGLVRVTVSRVGGPFDVEETSQTVTTRWRPRAAARDWRLVLMEGWYCPTDRLSEHKTTSYLKPLEVRRRARALGFDDGLSVSSDGHVGEASMANVFMLHEGEWRTPEVRGILPGVTRAAVIRAVERRGGRVVECEYDASTLESADAVVLTSTGVSVAPVASIGDVEYASAAAARQLSRWIAEELG